MWKVSEGSDDSIFAIRLPLMVNAYVNLVMDYYFNKMPIHSIQYAELSLAYYVLLTD